MPICAGAFDRRIQILRLDPAAKNDLGETEKTYSVLFSCWASRNYGAGREMKAAGAETAVESSRFTVRYAAATAGITVKDRLRYKGKDYDILSTTEVGTAEAIDIFVEGVVA